jgi:neprilysin
MFLNSTKIPDDKYEVSTTSAIRDQLNDQLRVILEEPIQSNEIVPFQNVKKFYKSCLDSEKIEELGSEPILKKFNAMGGWPVLMAEGSWNENEWTWEESVIKARANGFEFMFFTSFGVDYDTRNTSKRIVLVRTAVLNV